MSDPRAGYTLLHRVRALQRRALVLGGARSLLAAAVVLGAVPLVALPVVGWLSPPLRLWAAAGFLVLGVVAAGYLARREWRQARPRLSVAQAASLLAGGDPGQRRLLTTAADLAGWGAAGLQRRGASPELVQAQVAAAEAALPVSGKDVLPVVPLWRWAGGAALVLVLLAGWWHLDPGGTRPAWVALFTGGRPAPVAVGNLGVRLVPPAYAQQPIQTVEGADGAVQGLPGTRVTLWGRVSRAVDGGFWDGPAGESLPLQIRDTRFEVNWLLQRGGTYRLRFLVGRHAVASNLPARPITLREDQRPQVEMLQPEQDLEVTSDQEVWVEFGAVDDFQVQRAELVLSGAEEVRIPLVVPGEADVSGRARFLPLAHPQLGEGAHLRVEVWDNDTVSGPKVGVSRSVYVAFLDQRRLLADIEQLEERLLHTLLLHLADHLELPPHGAQEVLAGLRTRAGELLQLLERLVQQVGRGVDEGALSAVAVLRIEAGLRAVLEPFAAGAVGSQPVVPELERDILFLDRLLQSLRMEQALSLGDQLTALQRDLFDTLQAGGEPEDLLDQVMQIQQLLAQMAERLSRSAGDMPDAFANADAVREAPQNDLQELLRELSAALKAGDRERARQLAEQMLETLSQWMAALEDAAGASASEQLDPLLQQLQQLEQRVADLQQAQEALLDAGRRVGQGMASRARQSLQAQWQEFLARQEERLRRIEEASRRMEALPGRRGAHGAPGPATPMAGGSPLDRLHARQRVSAAAAELRNALRQDLARTRSGVDNLAQAVDDLAAGVEAALARETGAAESEPGPAAAAQARPREQLQRERQRVGEDLAALAAELERLTASRLDNRSAQDTARLGEQAREQDGLARQTAELGQDLEDLAGETPLVGGDLPQRAGSAQRSMQGASSALGEGDPFSATPQQGQALESLGELAQQLRGAKQQMLQGMQGSGMQMVRSPGQRPGGGRDVDRSRVEIPRESQAQELRAYREQVLRAMRDGQYPEDYREDVKRYYEGLIR